MLHLRVSQPSVACFQISEFLYFYPQVWETLFNRPFFQTFFVWFYIFFFVMFSLFFHFFSQFPLEVCCSSFPSSLRHSLLLLSISPPPPSSCLPQFLLCPQGSFCAVKWRRHSELVRQLKGWSRGHSVPLTLSFTLLALNSPGATTDISPIS